MTREQIAAERARIRDEDLDRMDRIKTEYGEDHRLFWAAMQFAITRLQHFDETHSSRSV